MTNWTEKYRPTKYHEIKGQDQAISIIKEFVENFKIDNAKKAILLGGSPGIGKTTIAEVFAKETCSELFELNASDFRDKERLKHILKPATEQRSLIRNKKIILIDEIDGISEADKGGITELISIIELSSYPIIATANDIWSKKLSALRKKTQILELDDISEPDIKSILIEILKKENKFLEMKILDEIIRTSRGDLRAAINDLQTISHLEKKDEIVFHERNKDEDIFHILKYIFQDNAKLETLGIFDKVNMSIDELILWVEENIPKIYQGKELVNAYERLSKVDVFKGRIYKQQYWRFLVYENALLSYGIAAAKKTEKKGFFKYKRPERILKIWLSNQKFAKKKTIAEKYSKLAHIGIKRALRDWNEIKNILKNSKVQEQLKLTEEEIEYLKR